MHRPYHGWIAFKLFLLISMFVFVRPDAGWALDFIVNGQRLNITLPEASQDFFVSDKAEKWTLLVEGNRFTLQTPVIKEGFSYQDALGIDRVLGIFAPAGGVTSQVSRIYDISGVWMLEISGVLSRPTAQGLVLNSMEVVYQDSSAELVVFGEQVSLAAMNAQSDGGGGCNGHFGFSALLMAGMVLLWERSRRTVLAKTGTRE